MTKEGSYGASTIAPPADAPSVDLDELFANMTVTPKHTHISSESSLSPLKTKSKKPSSSRPSTSRSSVPRSQRHAPEKAAPTKSSDGALTSDGALSTIPEDSSSSSRSGRTPPTMRPQSEFSSIGNMQRTFMEGLIPKTGYIPDIQPTAMPSMAGQAQYHHLPDAQTVIVSRAPSGVSSLLLDAADFKMASRQPLYNSMRGEEHRQQEKWAQNTIRKMSICPEGNDWKRRDDGYQCKGSTHFINDDLLAEGKGGMYLLYYPRDMAYRCGPYYPDPEKKTEFLYAGPKPPQPPWAADYLDAKGAGYFEAGGKKSEENLRLTPSILSTCTDKDLEILILMLKMGKMSPEEAREMLLSGCKKGLSGSSSKQAASPFATKEEIVRSSVQQSSRRPLSPSSQLTHMRIASTVKSVSYDRTHITSHEDPSPVSCAIVQPSSRPSIGSSSRLSRQSNSSCSLKPISNIHIHTISHLDSPPASQSSIRPTTVSGTLRASSRKPTQSMSHSSLHPSFPSALSTTSRTTVQPSSQSTLKPSSRSTVQSSSATILPTVSQLPFSPASRIAAQTPSSSASKRPSSKVLDNKRDAEDYRQVGQIVIMDI